MADNMLVRASRDGDQFHYLWAARRCLRLLSASSGLVAVTIEGASPSEASVGEKVQAGEELIDVAEYYGSQDVAQAALVRYIQLKHSTLHANDPWTPSGLEKTLSGFAQRYREFRKRVGTGAAIGNLEFWFVTNRPIGSDLVEAVEYAAAGTQARHPSDLKTLRHFTGLRGTDLRAFCRLLHFEGSQDGYWDQRNILHQDVTAYLPEADTDAPVQLKELVTRKALSEGAGNPVITKTDVLRALKTDEASLFAAPCRIEPIEGVVPREQEGELFDEIVRAGKNPVVVHATGGVGKTVFSTRIHIGLPKGSVSILYDCFGNGQYRSPSGYRHRHKIAFVQIANELASRGVCHPLIPSPNADSAAYMTAFLHRLKQSINSIKAENASALLCIVVDAADNAQLAAEEINEARSFVRDLLREEIPEGIRLVALCRTHRQVLLDPPPNVVRLELRSFSRNETAAHLRRTFPDATEHDIDEFHSLSSQNPRVQAIALSRKAPLNDVLRKLGPSFTTIDMAIERLLDEAVTTVRDKAGSLEKVQIDRICAGLAALRPLIPISVLASMSGVDEAAIRSFAFDLGRPLLVTGSAIQFFDEPAETWFRERFKPKGRDLAEFIESLKLLAPSSSYVASALPQLMLEAGCFSELVAMALSSRGLPDASPIERRDIELQRLQFALKASLRMGRYTDAAKLALKAGGESAGNERQGVLLQANTDLAAVLLDTDRIQEIVSRRTFGSLWIGSHHAYEAGLMSGRVELVGEARSRLRMAEEWLWNWSQLSDKERERERVTHADIAELATAHFNIHGATACATFFRRWKPGTISFRAGQTLARTFVDHGRYKDLDELAGAAGNNIWLVLAVTLELRNVHRNPPDDTIKRALNLVSSPHVTLEESERLSRDEAVLQAVTALVEAGYKLSACEPSKLARILARYLPDSPPLALSPRYGSTFPLMRAYALRASLSDESLVLMDLAHTELREELERNRHSDTQEAREFREDIGAVLPWHRLWAEVFVGKIGEDSLSNAIAEAESASTKAATTYREEWHASNEIARVWFDILLQAGTAEPSSMDKLNGWIGALKRPLYIPTLTRLARVAARSESLEQYALKYADAAFRIVKDEREAAETKAESYIDLARAILMASASDAAAYFDEAVKVASKVGDENLDRWAAMLDLADHAADRTRRVPEMAYKLARCAEVTYDYVARDKHFNWEGTVRAIAGLDPPSSLAILSRWRDRNFGRAERLLPEVTFFLIQRGDLDPRTALALIGFRAGWEPVRLLNSALVACTAKPDKDVAVAFFYRYMALHGHSSRMWRALKDLLASHKLVVHEVDDLTAFFECRETSATPAAVVTGDSPLPSSTRQIPDWDAVFASVDLGMASDLSRAYRQFRSGEPPTDPEEFFKEVCARVSIGKEAQFVSALADTRDLNLYDLRSFLQQLPEEWKGRLSIRTTLARAVKTFCRRFCRVIAKDRYYDVFPFDLVRDIAGVSFDEVVEVVLAALGETTETLAAKRLLTLVGLLGTKVSSSEALSALSFGLDLFNDVLEDKDGDGPWSAVLAPPADVESAIAGYVWAALAAPRASLRWQAAHVTRGLCTLGREKVIDNLVRLARKAEGGPFADGRLHFYGLHARQSFLIALARAARDNPRIILRHTDFLVELALNGAPHVLIRGFAARAALALFASGLFERQPELELRLANVNVPPFPAITCNPYGRLKPRQPGADDDGGDDHFYFGIDTGTHWFAPLGRCFGISENDVERAAKRVIRLDWQYAGTGRWDEDERQRRRLFRDWETLDSRSDPRSHNLQFYFSYHAVMIVAGRLLATTAPHRDSDERTDDFGRWLNDNSLVRTDGGWLADRRDPTPLELVRSNDDGQTRDWCWSIRRADFDNLLLLPAGRVNVWGNWTSVSNGREEYVRIRSALVSPSRSHALLRALQSAGPHRCGFPVARDDDPESEDDAEISRGEFQFKPWIAHRYDRSGLDERDPWAGDISYPPASPAQHVIDLMELDTDFERRRWRVRGDQEDRVALWSHIWGQYREKGNDEPAEGGQRLQSSFSFIQAFLTKVNMDLILGIQIERRLHHARYERSEDYEFGYIEPSARFFLVKSDGRLFTI